MQLDYLYLKILGVGNFLRDTDVEGETAEWVQLGIIIVIVSPLIS